MKYSTVAARVAPCLEVADSGIAAAVETGEKAGEIYQEFIEKHYSRHVGNLTDGATSQVTSA